MFNSIINGSKKSKKSKKSKEVKDDLSAPPQVQAPGSYIREAGILFLTDKFDHTSTAGDHKVKSMSSTLRSKSLIWQVTAW